MQSNSGTPDPGTRRGSTGKLATSVPLFPQTTHTEWFVLGVVVKRMFGALYWGQLGTLSMPRDAARLGAGGLVITRLTQVQPIRVGLLPRLTHGVRLHGVRYTEGAREQRRSGKLTVHSSTPPWGVSWWRWEIGCEGDKYCRPALGEAGSSVFEK